MPEVRAGMETFIGDDGSYRTGERPLSAFSKRFPSMSFIPRMCGVVLGASRAAKRGMYTDQKWQRDSLRIMRQLESVGVKIDVEGAARLWSVDGPCVIVANHMSTLETFILPAVISPYKAVTFVVKEELVRYPVFGPIMRSRDPIVVGRRNPREDLKAVLEGGAARLSRGVSVCVFPQTTRSAGFDTGEFNSIGVKLARRAGVPLVPLALRTDAWAQGRLVKDVGRIRPSLPVRFHFGSPIGPSVGGAVAQASVVEFIAGKLRAWGLPVLEGGATSG